MKLAFQSLLSLTVAITLSACGANVDQAAPPSSPPANTSSDDAELRSAYDTARGRLEAADRQRNAADAASRNMQREANLKIIATALDLYRLDNTMLPRVGEGELTAEGSPLVGKYIASPVTPPRPGEVFCYGYSTDGTMGFVSGWLEIEDRPASFSITPLPIEETERINAVLEGAQTTYSCPPITGYTVRSF